MGVVLGVDYFFITQAYVIAVYIYTYVFKTIRKKVLQDGDITISGTYGTAFENCSIVGNIVSETGEPVSGIFVLSDMEADKLQQVYSCEDNGKLIGVEFYPENDDYVSENVFNAKIQIKKKAINVQARTMRRGLQELHLEVQNRLEIMEYLR